MTRGPVRDPGALPGAVLARLARDELTAAQLATRLGRSKRTVQSILTRLRLEGAVEVAGKTGYSTVWRAVRGG